MNLNIHLYPGGALIVGLDVDAAPRFNVHFEHLDTEQPSKILDAARTEAFRDRAAPAARRTGLEVRDDVVIDHARGLMWSREDVVPKCTTQAKAAQACADLRLGGFDDWRLPTRAELLTLVDDTRYAPAINIEAFPTCKKDWYWTSTPTAWSSGVAWIVNFGYGYSSSARRDYHAALARAVRSVPAGQ